jgi:hypothetical protein
MYTDIKQHDETTRIERPWSGKIDMERRVKPAKLLAGKDSFLDQTLLHQENPEKT